MTPQTPAIARLRSAQFYKAFAASHRATVGDVVAIPSTFIPFRPSVPLASLTSRPGSAFVVRQLPDGTVHAIGEIVMPVNSFDLMDGTPGIANDFARNAAAAPPPPTPIAGPVTIAGLGATEPSPITITS